MILTLKSNKYYIFIDLNTSIDKMKEVEKSGKLHQEMMGFRKKNNLDLPGLSPEVISGWLK